MRFERGWVTPLQRARGPTREPPGPGVAKTKLREISPDAAKDLTAALSRTPRRTERVAAPGGEHAAIPKTSAESQVRKDPGKRANRGVEDWRDLNERRDKF